MMDQNPLMNVGRRPTPLPVTRRQLVAQTAKDTGRSIDDVDAVVTAFLERVASTLADDKGVLLRGFGTFTPKVRRAETRKHPGSGVEQDYGPEVRVNFRPGRPLKRLINGHEVE